LIAANAAADAEHQLRDKIKNGHQMSKGVICIAGFIQFWKGLILPLIDVNRLI